MSNLPITFENKVNSPELLAFLAQYGETKYLSAEEINQIKGGLNELYNSVLGSGITSNLTPQFVDQDIVFPQFFSWKFLGTETILDTNVSIPVPFAVTGKHRQDLIIAENGILIRIPGLEVDLATPVYEPLYNNTTQLRITSFEVNESGYGEPLNIIVGTDFIKKSFSQPLYYAYTGSNVIIPLPPTGNEKFVFTDNGLVSISGFNLSLITGNPSAEIPYNGKEIIVFNGTANPITINHNAVADIPYLIKDAANLIVPSGELVRFMYEGGVMKELFRSWGGGFKFSYHKFGRFFTNLFGATNEGKWLSRYSPEVNAFAINTGVTDKALLVPNYASFVYRVPQKCKIINMPDSAGGPSDYQFVIFKSSDSTGLDPVEVFYGQSVSYYYSFVNPNIILQEGDCLHFYYKRTLAGPSFYSQNITFQTL